MKQEKDNIETKSQPDKPVNRNDIERVVGILLEGLVDDEERKTYSVDDLSLTAKYSDDDIKKAFAKALDFTLPTENK